MAFSGPDLQKQFNSPLLFAAPDFVILDLGERRVRCEILRRNEWHFLDKDDIKCFAVDKANLSAKHPVMLWWLRLIAGLVTSFALFMSLVESGLKQYTAAATYLILAVAVYLTYRWISRRVLSVRRVWRIHVRYMKENDADTPSGFLLIYGGEDEQDTRDLALYLASITCGLPPRPASVTEEDREWAIIRGRKGARSTVTRPDTYRLSQE